MAKQSSRSRALSRHYEQRSGALARACTPRKSPPDSRPFMGYVRNESRPPAGKHGRAADPDISRVSQSRGTIVERRHFFGPAVAEKLPTGAVSFRFRTAQSLPG